MFKSFIQRTRYLFTQSMAYNAYVSLLNIKGIFIGCSLVNYQTVMFGDRKISNGIKFCFVFFLCQLQGSVTEYEFSQEEFRNLQREFWCKFYACCLQYQEALSHPLALLLNPHTNMVCLLKKVRELKHTEKLLDSSPGLSECQSVVCHSQLLGLRFVFGFFLKLQFICIQIVSALFILFCISFTSSTEVISNLRFKSYKNSTKNFCIPRCTVCQLPRAFLLSIIFFPGPLESYRHCIPLTLYILAYIKDQGYSYITTAQFNCQAT